MWSVMSDTIHTYERERERARWVIRVIHIIPNSPILVTFSIRITCHNGNLVYHIYIHIINNENDIFLVGKWER